MINKNEGSITGLWRFPVKSMLGERLDEAVVTERGIVGDRAYALVEVETGKTVSAKNHKRYPKLFACKAAFVEPPQLGEELPPVIISLSDGSVVRSDADDINSVLSAFFGQNLTLEKVAPAEIVIDMDHPDVEGAVPPGGENMTTIALGTGAISQLGIDVEAPVPEGLFFDLFPLSCLTTATLNKLNELQPESRFDERRFRMNVIIETEQSGFVESDWVGKQLDIGEAVQLQIGSHCIRCVMTTLAQEELPRDVEVMRTLVRHNRQQFGDLGKLPCAGVYALSTRPGVIRVGDAISLISD